MLYNSDTKYPESAQIPEVSRFSPTRPTLTSGTSHQFQVVTCTSNQLGISQEFLQPPPWVWYLSRRAHRTQLTGKHYHLLLIKDKTQKQPGASLAVQWFRFCASNAGCMRSIPGAGTKIPHDSWHGQKKKKTKTPPETKLRKPNGRDSQGKLCENGVNFHALSGLTTLLAHWCVQQPRSSPKLVIEGFYGAFIM